MNRPVPLIAPQVCGPSGHSLHVALRAAAQEFVNRPVPLIAPQVCGPSGHSLRVALSAVAESFFNLLKRERIRCRTYKTRVEARQDMFDYIEMFDDQKRKHVRNGMLSPIEFERQQETKTGGVYKLGAIQFAVTGRFTVTWHPAILNERAKHTDVSGIEDGKIAVCYQ